MLALGLIHKTESPTNAAIHHVTKSRQNVNVFCLASRCMINVEDLLISLHIFTAVN